MDRVRASLRPLPHPFACLTAQCLDRLVGLAALRVQAAGEVVYPRLQLFSLCQKLLALVDEALDALRVHVALLQRCLQLGQGLHSLAARGGVGRQAVQHLPLVRGRSRTWIPIPVPISWTWRRAVLMLGHVADASPWGGRRRSNGEALRIPLPRRWALLPRAAAALTAQASTPRTLVREITLHCARGKCESPTDLQVRPRAPPANNCFRTAGSGSTQARCDRQLPPPRRCCRLRGDWLVR